jgi:apolipoprotein N-acyltransferase
LLFEAYVARRLNDMVTFRWLAGAAVYVPVALYVGGSVALISTTLKVESDSRNYAGRRKVAVIQGNVGKISGNASFEDMEQYRSDALNTYVQMTRFLARQNASQSGSDLAFILWPETVVPWYCTRIGATPPCLPSPRVRART